MKIQDTPNIMQVIMSRKMTCVRHVVHVGGEGDAYRALVGKSEKRPL